MTGGPNGRPAVKFQGKVVYAYRLLEELLRGPLPDDWEVHHRCGNRACLAPGHLLRMSGEEHRQLHAGTTCLYGHAFDEENTRHWNGRRICKRCQTRRSREWRDRQRREQAA